MKRWQFILILLLAITVGITVYFIFIHWLNGEEPTNKVSPPEIQVNAYARLAASGSPLPSPAWEDVVVEQQQFDGRIFYLSYDQETDNWQLDWQEAGTQQSLRYLKKENIFFYFNPFDLIWDEVDFDFIHQDFKELIEIDQFLLNVEQLDAFNALAFEEQSLACSQDSSAICAVWQAKNFQDNIETLIYVNKRTRKIDQVIVLSPQPGETTLIATYIYQPVTIGLPAEGDIRYLNKDE